MDAPRTSTAELSRLHWRLGEHYADCLTTTIASSKRKPTLIACHGQTIYHQATAALYAGAPTGATWQAGEPSVIAARLGLPVVSDFRTADLAAGGQGAPLVPMLDYTLFRHATKNRLMLNLGGIANVTALPAACTTSQVLAFDTGPANMVIDACMTHLYNKPFDAGGRTAAKGRSLAAIVERFSHDAFFALPPPKSCGREEFGARFVLRFLAACRKVSTSNEDIIATATALTASTLREAYARFCWPHFGQLAPLARTTELIAAGGGTRNLTLMRQITADFAALGITVTTIDQTSSAIPSEAKEATAFALLGWLTWHQVPGNIPSATGASRPVILGKVTYA